MIKAKLSKDGWSRGLAALILLAPGGFVLGFTLAARHYGKRSRAVAPGTRSLGAAGEEAPGVEAADDQGS